MIQINIDNSVNLEKLTKLHYNYFKNNGYNKLIKYRKKRKNNNVEKRFYSYLISNIRDVIMGRPDVLNKIINKINNKFPKIRKKIKNKNSTINKELNKIFDYDKFSRLGPRKNKPNRWRAYQLTKELNLNVCPYCNRQYITTYYSSSGKVRAELDHFFDKKRHPYFALSFYNLIPSCHVCNSNLKGSKEFKYKKNLHPYESGFGDNLKFTIKIKENQKTNNEDLKYDLDFFYGDSEQFEINFKENIKKESDKDLIRKAKNNAEIFKIKELYNSHKNHISELIKKSIIYNSTRINDLYEQYYGELFNSKEDIIRMIVDNYIDEENYNKKAFAKLTKDISEELGLIENK